MLPHRLTMCDDVWLFTQQDAAGQFCDKGHSYISVLYYDGPGEEAAARASKVDAEAELRASGRLAAGASVATLIRPRSRLWPAETYHQNYYRKKPDWYNYYKGRCGRVNRLRDVWGNTAGSHAFSHAMHCAADTGGGTSSPSVAGAPLAAATQMPSASSIKPGETGDYSLPIEARWWIAGASVGGCIILFVWFVAIRRCRRRRQRERGRRRLQTVEAVGAAPGVPARPDAKARPAMRSNPMIPATTCPNNNDALAMS